MQLQFQTKLNQFVIRLCITKYIIFNLFNNYMYTVHFTLYMNMRNDDDGG